MKGSSLIIPAARIERRIFYIRGVKVMLSSDLAELYGVAVKALNQAVKRNLDRFPEDFMFQLSGEEFNDLKSQFVTSSWGGMRRALPYAFSEHGIAMLSSVLKSSRAIQVNIEIMRAFVKLRQMLSSNAELARTLNNLEQKYDRQFKIVFDAIRQMMNPPPGESRPIGYGPPGCRREPRQQIFLGPGPETTCLQRWCFRFRDVAVEPEAETGAETVVARTADRCDRWLARHSAILRGATFGILRGAASAASGIRAGSSAVKAHSRMDPRGLCTKSGFQSPR